ncbi:DNA polymerase III subunit chi [Pararhodobacter sp.]|uniref:DNA polymerase III subunit chi n=1 Tax=Pararhodobacter sp. TaxID=2127056 RepID=UPI002AFE2367|nr:DNA polymerase III subunit chi [Pararhodobacter sp.]
MAVAKFYHLTRDPLETLLPKLIGRALEMGMTVALRGTDTQRMQALDRQLWLNDGFLPHGMVGGPHDADQPVLLVADATPVAALANQPGCLITLDSAPVTPDEARAVERLCIVFDGTNDWVVAQARQQWRALTGADVAAEYWNRESGRWACVAQHPKP